MKKLSFLSKAVLFINVLFSLMACDALQAESRDKLFEDTKIYAESAKDLIRSAQDIRSWLDILRIVRTLAEEIHKLSTAQILQLTGFTQSRWAELNAGSWNQTLTISSADGLRIAAALILFYPSDGVFRLSRCDSYQKALGKLGPRQQSRLSENALRMAKGKIGSGSIPNQVFFWTDAAADAEGEKQIEVLPQREFLQDLLRRLKLNDHQLAAIARSLGLRRWHEIKSIVRGTRSIPLLDKDIEALQRYADSRSSGTPAGATNCATEVGEAAKQ